jgi:hypothetical protein
MLRLRLAHRGSEPRAHGARRDCELSPQALLHRLQNSTVSRSRARRRRRGAGGWETHDAICRKQKYKEQQPCMHDTRDLVAGCAHQFQDPPSTDH